MRLKDKVAIITGAASGMGAAHARLFVKEGAKVTITDVNETAGKALENELGSDNALFLKHDVSKLEEWRYVVAEAENKFGQVSILVNNAGINITEPIEAFTEENYRKVIAVNQDSVAFGMAAVAASMRKGKTGSIINISSGAGFVGIKDMTAYTASKFAVRGITKAAALDLAGYNIRVNSVHPGFVRTPILDTLSPEDLAKMVEPIPFKRLAEPAEISPLIVFLASDESIYCTGSEFIMDGGLLCAL